MRKKTGTKRRLRHASDPQWRRPARPGQFPDRKGFVFGEDFTKRQHTPPRGRNDAVAVDKNLLHVISSRSESRWRPQSQTNSSTRIRVWHARVAGPQEIWRVDRVCAW